MAGLLVGCSCGRRWGRHRDVVVVEVVKAVGVLLGSELVWYAVAFSVTVSSLIGWRVVCALCGGAGGLGSSGMSGLGRGVGHRLGLGGC